MAEAVKITREQAMDFLTSQFKPQYDKGGMMGAEAWAASYQGPFGGYLNQVIAFCCRRNSSGASRLMPSLNSDDLVEILEATGFSKSK